MEEVLVSLRGSTVFWLPVTTRLPLPPPLLLFRQRLLLPLPSHRHHPVPRSGRRSDATLMVKAVGLSRTHRQRKLWVASPT